MSLTPELEKFVQEKLASGLYTSASEVIRESLRLLLNYENIQQHQLEQLNQAIDLGLNQLSTGKKTSAEIVYQRLKTKLDKIAKSNK